jgi:diaminopimelate decarboxylase
MTGAFSYRAGRLHAEEVPLETIAAAVGTPFYCYSTAQLQKNYRDFAAPFARDNARIYYAIKANPNQAVIRVLAGCGAGADVTSAGEMERAFNAGIAPGRTVYSGVGKKRDEIAAALLAGIYQINVESLPELNLVSEVATELKRTAPIGLRINPDVAADTHPKLSTGAAGIKFGIDIEQLDEAMKLAARLPTLSFKGFSVHIASHVSDYRPFREAYGKMADLVRAWQAKGVKIERLDLGGGVGIPYDNETLPPFADYVQIVRDITGELGCELAFEPGRKLTGDAGVLVSRVLYDKRGAHKRFLILDAGMNDLVRPAMYEARHSIIPLRESNAEDEPADIVGPVCETGDLFGSGYRLPGISQNDMVAILQAGAYGASMGSGYNGRPLIPEVLVTGANYAIVRRRIAVAEQIAWESWP